MLISRVEKMNTKLLSEHCMLITVIVITLQWNVYLFGQMSRYLNVSLSVWKTLFYNSHYTSVFWIAIQLRNERSKESYTEKDFLHRLFSFLFLLLWCNQNIFGCSNHLIFIFGYSMMSYCCWYCISELQLSIMKYTNRRFRECQTVNLFLRPFEFYQASFNGFVRNHSHVSRIHGSNIESEQKLSLVKMVRGHRSWINKRINSTTICTIINDFYWFSFLFQTNDTIVIHYKTDGVRPAFIYWSSI